MKFGIAVKLALLENAVKLYLFSFIIFNVTVKLIFFKNGVHVLIWILKAVYWMYPVIKEFEFKHALHLAEQKIRTTLH